MTQRHTQSCPGKRGSVRRKTVAIQTLSPAEPPIQHREKLIRTELELARLFLAHNKPDIARRRLETVLRDGEDLSAANEARELLRSL